MRKPQIIVIGGNAAGPSAAAKAKRVDPDADVKLFEGGPFISTGTCELPYLISGIIDDYKKIIFFTPEQFYEEKRVNVYVNHLVESIDRKEKKIYVTNINDGTKLDIPYDRIILATGSKARSIINTSRAENFFTYKSVSDYLKVADYLKVNKVKNIVIIGAGYIGLEVAENLKKMNYNVTILEKAKLPMPSSEPEISHIVKSKLEEEKIELVSGFTQLKFNYRNEKISSVNVDGRLIDTCMIISSIGVEPNSQLAISSNLSVGNLGGIKVDTKLKTSDPNIFAAGDCIEVKNAVTNTMDYIPLATLAHDQGHIAGENAAGGNVFYEPVVKNAAVKIFDNVFATVGISSQQVEKLGIQFQSVDAVVPNLVKVIPWSANTFGKIIFEKISRKILGAEFIGKSEVIGYADLISALILRREKVDFITKINFNYTPPNSPFINILSVLGRKAGKK
jgi:NADPH-dependent 2,4-dienoyl-CoA reductase/sulfur reductase-like enzyme